MEITNITNMPNPHLLEVGTICNLVDKVDPSEGTMCTIRFIEEDDEYSGLYYYYLRANDEKKNIQADPRFGNYFTMVPFDSEYLLPISPATVY